MKREMTPEQAVERFRYYYEAALRSDYVRHPVAWALYQTWKEAEYGAA